MDKLPASTRDLPVIVPAAYMDPTINVMSRYRHTSKPTHGPKTVTRARTGTMYPSRVQVYAGSNARSVMSEPNRARLA